ncbi:hypothetical protein, partial [Parabacteroides sp. CH2-D42-20]|uniref:hypothetical protein n=1 Tax=Parabacteroides sp. CH2-D42-20 TaxID=2320086 RepID=UPI001F46C551
LNFRYTEYAIPCAEDFLCVRDRCVYGNPYPGKVIRTQYDTLSREWRGNPGIRYFGSLPEGRFPSGKDGFGRVVTERGRSRH